ncbi:MAG TPA: hypothetical protein PLF85_16640, partial [Turneriella sp.]|nr:hypothetical protein [Turneriella sp.]
PCCPLVGCAVVLPAVAGGRVPGVVVAPVPGRAGAGLVAAGVVAAGRAGAAVDGAPAGGRAGCAHNTAVMTVKRENPTHSFTFDYRFSA